MYKSILYDKQYYCYMFQSFLWPFSWRGVKKGGSEKILQKFVD